MHSSLVGQSQEKSTRPKSHEGLWSLVGASAAVGGVTLLLLWAPLAKAWSALVN